MKTSLILAFLFASLPVTGQVDKIKAASADYAGESKSTDTGGSSSGSGNGGIFVDILMFLPHWQAYKLQDDRQRYPPMVSLDVFIQGAFKPADTYIFWPRIRANWGLFSTDFRMNYMMEKNDTGGFTSLRTSDWQVLQLNLITSRFITFRVGAGTMTEAFGANRQFTEVTLAFGIHAPDQSEVFFLEYRDAFESGADVHARFEFSGQYQHQIFKTGGFRGYLTAGGAYQKYYNTIDFWGIEAGVLFRLY